MLLFCIQSFEFNEPFLDKPGDRSTLMYVLIPDTKLIRAFFEFHGERKRWINFARPCWICQDLRVHFYTSHINVGILYILLEVQFEIIAEYHIFLHRAHRLHRGDTLLNFKPSQEVVFIFSVEWSLIKRSCLEKLFIRFNKQIFGRHVLVELEEQIKFLLNIFFC